MSYKPYLNQNYQELKDKCLKSKKLFEDDKFKANNSSLAKFKVPDNISWKRPHEIFENPQFIVNFIVPDDIDQARFKKFLNNFIYKFILNKIMNPGFFRKLLVYLSS